MPLMVAILTASSGSTPHATPVGRTVTGPGKTSRIDQGFQQYRADSVAFLPVVREAARRQRQGAAGQIPDTHPRKDQKPAVADNLLKIAPTGLIAPADPLFP